MSMFSPSEFKSMILLCLVRFVGFHDNWTRHCRGQQCHGRFPIVGVFTMESLEIWSRARHSEAGKFRDHDDDHP
jgi:hypothetical protein